MGRTLKTSKATEMIESNEQRRHAAMTDSPNAVQELLRNDILVYGISESVSMADVRGCLDRRGLATAPAVRQQLVLDTVRSLLGDGLIEVGNIPGSNDPGFLVWPGGIDEVMRELADRIVDRWDDPDSWEYSTWLNLTPAGQTAAAQVPPED